MNFNPANFAVNAQAQARQERAQAPAPSAVAQKIAAQEQAAARWAIRRDDFAAGKSDTCLDMAAKLQRFGSFVSEKQAGYADKLIEWSLPRQPATVYVPPVCPAPAPAPAPKPVPAAIILPKLFDLMQRLAKLRFNGVNISRKNGDSLCWVKLPSQDGVVGKIEGGVLSLFAGRMSVAQGAEVLAALLAIEADPERAAVLYGKASGNCAICGRDLTDPESIERGIGPICAEKF
jgi:hypothetical protein